jgi:hypothetical protein
MVKGICQKSKGVHDDMHVYVYRALYMCLSCNSGSRIALLHPNVQHFLAKLLSGQEIQRNDNISTLVHGMNTGRLKISLSIIFHFS